MQRVDSQTSSAPNFEADNAKAEDQSRNAAPEAKAAKATQSKASMNSVSSAFYQQYALKQFDNANAPMSGEDYEAVLGKSRLAEMVTRSPDAQVRELASGGKVAPMQLMKAYQLQLATDHAASSSLRPSEVDAAFKDSTDWAEKLLSELRGLRFYTYHGRPQTDANLVSILGAYEPELLLAERLAKHGELGGSQVLVRSAQRTYLPDDLQPIRDGIIAMTTPVASTVQAAAEGRQYQALANADILYGLLATIPNIEKQLAGVRGEWSVPGSRALPAGSRVRDAANIDRLREVFGGLQNLFNRMPGSIHTVELTFMLERLLADPDTSLAVKRAALSGFDEAIRRATAEKPSLSVQSESGHAETHNVFTSLPAALRDIAITGAHKDVRVKTIGGKQTPAFIEDMLKSALRASNDPRFIADAINAGAQVDLADALFQIPSARVRKQVSESVLAATAPENKLSGIGVMADRKARTEALKQLLAAKPDVKLADTQAALLLSWPSDVPRATTSEAAFADVAKLPAIAAVAAQPNATLDALYAAIASDCTGLSFAPRGADSDIPVEIQQIIRGEKSAAGRMGGLFGSKTDELMACNALAALPKQFENGPVSEANLRGRLTQAVKDGNGEILKQLPLLFAKGGDIARWTFDAVRTAVEQNASSGNTLFNWALITACNAQIGKIGDEADRSRLKMAAQNALKSSEYTSLTRLMGLSTSENAQIILKLPLSDARLPFLLSELTLPEDIAFQMLTRGDANQLTAHTAYELLSQVLANPKVKADDIVKASMSVIAAGGASLSPTNAYVLFSELAASGAGAAVGKQIIETLKAGNRADLLPVLAVCASETTLFDANDVAELMLATPDSTFVSTICAENTDFMSKLSDDRRLSVVTAVVTRLQHKLDGSVFDLALPLFSMIADLTSRGVKLSPVVQSGLTAIAGNAIARAGVKPIEAYDLRNVLDKAAECGVDVPALAAALLKRDDPFASQPRNDVLQPQYYATACLELARAVPSLDLANVVTTLNGTAAPGPVTLAFDVFMDGPRAYEVDSALCALGIRWATEQSNFPAVLEMRARLEEPGMGQQLAIFDEALVAAVSAKAEVWQAVPEARAVVARIKMGEMASDIKALADGGNDAAAIADRLSTAILGAGPSAAELVPQVLDAVRRLTRAQRPSLDEVQVVRNVSMDGVRKQAAVKAPVEMVDFHGIDSLPRYAGELGNDARVPPVKPYSVSPGVAKNTRRLIQALKSDKKMVLVLSKPGVGKTFTSEQIAAITGTPFTEVDGGPELTTGDLAGGWSTDNKGNPIFKKKAVLRAMEKGGFVCFDEINASTQEFMLAVGNMIGSGRDGTFVRTDKNERLKLSPHFKAVFNGNFLDSEIPKQIRKHVHVVYMDDLDVEDQKMIAGLAAPDLADEGLTLLANMQANVDATIAMEDYQGEGSPTARNMVRAAKRAERYRGADPKLASARAARETYLDGVADREDGLDAKGKVNRKSDLTRMTEAFQTIFEMHPDETLPQDGDLPVKQQFGRLTVGEASVVTGPLPTVAPASVTIEAFGAESPMIFTTEIMREIEQIAKAMELGQSMLYRAGDHTSVRTIFRAFSQLSGWPTYIQNCHREVTEYDMFGADTLRETDVKGQFETFFAGGFITEVAKNGGVLVLDDVEELSSDVRIKLHRMLTDRVVPGAGGVLEPMHPNALIIMRSAESKRLGEAFVNRLQERNLKPRSPEAELSMLKEVARRIGVSEDIATDIMHYDEIWRRAVHNVIATYIRPQNMPIPTLGKKMHWLQDFAALFRGECTNPAVLFNEDGSPASIDQQVRNQLIEGGLAYYPVPDHRERDAEGTWLESDVEKCRRILTALAEGRSEEADAIVPKS